MKHLHFLLLYSSFFLCNTYKILVLNPKFAFSHVQFVGRIAEVLAEGGNEVVQLVVEMDPSVKINGSEKVKNVIYPSMESVEKRLQNSGKHLNVWKSEHGSMEQLNLVMDIIETNRDVGVKMIYDKALRDWVREQKFDMAAWEIDTTIAISAIPLVETYRWFYGLDYPASYLPGINMNFNDKMSYAERFSNLFNYVIMRLAFDYDKSYSYSKMLSDVYPEKNINHEEECGDVSFLFLNTHPYLDFPQTLPPKIQEIGGIAIPEGKPLSKKWDDILNKRKVNVLLSFGTIVQTKNMPSHIRANIINTFLSFKNVTFIWKVDKDDIDIGKNYDNIIVTSWIPQSDLLADERLYLFITHCGLNSFMELTYNGKVALAIPFLADQFRNSQLINKAGSGKAIDKKDLEDENEFTNIVRDMLENIVYKKKALRIQELIKNRPMGSKEILLKHVEIAKKFKKLPELDLGSRKLNFIKYYNLDIILPVLFVISFILYTIYFAIRKTIIILCFAKSKYKVD